MIARTVPVLAALVLVVSGVLGGPARLTAGRAALAGGAKAPAEGGRVLAVGPSHRLKTPSEAAALARDGDTIEIEAGVYGGDVAVWKQHGLTLRGVRGRVELRANGRAAQGKGIWVLAGNDTTVENIEFSGARVPDRNGAGIRLTGSGLTVRRCVFRENETGILAGGDEASDVLVEHSEFARNGHPGGRSHNLYIGAVRSFTFRFSYAHHAIVGHNVKSRARLTSILYSRISDEESGSASYAIDVPQGGLALIIGNVIQKGPKAENGTAVAYGAEAAKGWHPIRELWFVNNTVVNDRPASGRFVRVHPDAAVARLVNNLFVGPGTVLTGPGEIVSSLHSGAPGLLDRAGLDYRLTATSAAIDGGTDPGSAHGIRLAPTAHYVHRASGEARSPVGRIDLGAYEFGNQGGPLAPVFTQPRR